MPRIRTIKPDFWHDEKLARRADHSTRLTFIGLWCYADRDGRLEDRPEYLKAMLWPYEEVDIESHLKSLSVGKFILRYRADDGKRYIQIINFPVHQKPHHTERPSVIPVSPVYEKMLTVKSRLNNGDTPAGREGKGMERKGREVKSAGAGIDGGNGREHLKPETVSPSHQDPKPLAHRPAPRVEGEPFTAEIPPAIRKKIQEIAGE